MALANVDLRRVAKGAAVVGNRLVWRASGWIGEPTPTQIRYGGTSRASTNTNIVRYATSQVSVGSDLSFTDSATDGSYWTVNTAGRYLVTVCIAASSDLLAVVKCASTLNNNVSLANTDYFAAVNVASSSGMVVVTAVVDAALNDKVWVAASADPDNTNARSQRISILGPV